MLGRHEKLCMIKREILGYLKHGDDAIFNEKGNFKDERSFEM